MIQEITAHCRNSEEMNVKTEKHIQHDLASIRRENGKENGVKHHQYFVKSIWWCSIGLDLWQHRSHFLTVSGRQSIYNFLSSLTRQLIIFQHVEIPAWCKSSHIRCREGKGLTKVVRQSGNIHTVDEAPQHTAHHFVDPILSGTTEKIALWLEENVLYTKFQPLCGFSSFLQKGNSCCCSFG